MIQKKFLVIIFVLFLSAACNRAPGDSAPPGDRETKTESEAGEETATPLPTRSTIVETTILADGQLVAVNPTLPLSFKTGGRLVEINVAAGDQVSAGDLIAVLDDEDLVEAVTNAELAVDQAENSLAQAQLALDDLLNWEPDDLAVSVAEANLEAAEANYDQALSQDAVSGNSLTSARVSLEQAQRSLADSQERYDNAWDEARDWEQYIDDPICHPGQGGAVPCTGIAYQERIKNDREGTTRALQGAQDGLAVARANYNLAQAGLSNNTALDAGAAVVNAQQALHQAQTGPKENEITAAQLQVGQAELSLQQAEFNLEGSLLALENARLYAPWSGSALSVDIAPGAIVAAGTPIVTLLDNEDIQFHTSNLSERDLAAIEPGQPGEISLKTYPGQTINGTAVYIVPQASGQIGDAAAFTVVIELEQTELELWPGMTGRIEIQGEEE